MVSIKLFLFVGVKNNGCHKKNYKSVANGDDGSYKSLEPECEQNVRQCKHDGSRKQKIELEATGLVISTGFVQAGNSQQHTNMDDQENCCNSHCNVGHATYKIKGDTITFEFADEDEVSNSSAKKVIQSLEEPVSFEKGDGFIKINGVKYEKVGD